MIRPANSEKTPGKDAIETKKSLPEILATTLAFISVFIFFVKILFF